MANKNNVSRSDSEGLGWADQWDYKFNDDNNSNVGLQKSQPVTKKAKMQELNKKAKAAASTGFAKAKVGATVAASKIKTGSSAGVSWIKQQIEKRKASKGSGSA